MILSRRRCSADERDGAFGHCASEVAVGGGGEQRMGGRFCMGSSACNCMESHIVGPGQPFITAGHAGGERPSRARVGRTARANRADCAPFYSNRPRACAA